MSSCLRDKKYWSKPDEFYPEHFLDSSGKLRQNVDGFIPFSIGNEITLLLQFEIRINYNVII